MFRTLFVCCCLSISTLCAQELVAEGDAAVELEFVEWSASHFPASCTDTFELEGEWVEYFDDDGYSRFAATGDGEHSVHVIQVDDVVSETVSAGTEVFWQVDDDDELANLTVTYGALVGEWLPLGGGLWNGGVQDVSKWTESVCSKRNGRTTKWTCETSKKACKVKIQSSQSGSSTRKGDCDGKHVFSFNKFSQSLTFWVE